jgi:Ras-related protein Rab-5C
MSKKSKSICTLKCVLLGSAGIGKTSIVAKYMTNNFATYTASTIGAAFNTKTINTSHGRVKIDIWDTAGQERFDSMIPLYYRNAQIVLAIYDITSNESYIRATKWIDIITRENMDETIFVLVGNKIDLNDKREVESKRVSDYVKEKGILFFECSAKTGENINEIFNEAAKTSLKKVIRDKSGKNISIIETSGKVDLEKPPSDLMSQIGYCFSYLNPYSYGKG